MTDNEIIKALECCGKNPPVCSQCGYKGRCNRIDCYDYLKRDALDLINRQNAEIERLKKEQHQFDDLGKMYSEIKSEAIKEFVERLEVHTIEVDVSFGYGREHYTEAVTTIAIDNLVKEMAGEGG